MLVLDHLDWLPPYRLRKTRAAKSIRLSLSHNTLLISYPPYVSEKSVRKYLLSQRDWILTHWQTIQIDKPPLVLPTELNLSFLNQILGITYARCSGRSGFTSSNEQLTVLTPEDNPAVQKEVLMYWLKLQAKYHLPPALHSLSQQAGLPFNRVSIREAKTRWGSCSNEKNISLNYTLICFPTALANHVMLHELCHTKHLNHSRAFWALLTNLDPKTEAHKKMLKSTEQYLPAFLLGS